MLKLIRCRRATFLMCLLLGVTAGTMYAVVRDGSGPYAGDVTVAFESTMEWNTTGYARLPDFDPNQKCFRSFPNGYWQGRGRFLSYCVFDAPFWPGGDPGHGADNPLPPLVRRKYILGVAPELPLTILAVAWGAWGILFFREERRINRGFDVLGRKQMDANNQQGDGATKTL